MSPADSPLSGLPPASPQALAHSQRLAAHIRAEMDRNDGALPFHRYMDLALYAPGLGYYVAGSHKLGEGGDFVTAPELTPLFGRCLGRQCAEVLDALGGGDVLEFGAGSGALAAALLPEMQSLGRLPGCYCILEPSPDLRERQRAALGELEPALADRVRWLDRLPPTFDGVMLANEVVDAMPVHGFVMRAGRVAERCVRARGEGFEGFEREPAGAELAAAVSTLQEMGVELADGYRSEVNLRAGPWVAALGGALRSGAAFIIDYGYPRSEYYLPERNMGTLMCHYRHRAHPDPFHLPGLQDITAYVDFSALAEAGLAAGLDLAGYTTQANFLLGCGLEGLLADSDPAAPLDHLALMQGVKRLLLPGEMGERFQVLGLSRGLECDLMCFSMRDLRHRL
jgi:SAM-dependent MidA family methyltransferase